MSYSNTSCLINTSTSKIITLDQLNWYESSLVAPVSISYKPDEETVWASKSVKSPFGDKVYFNEINGVWRPTVSCSLASTPTQEIYLQYINKLSAATKTFLISSKYMVSVAGSEINSYGCFCADFEDKNAFTDYAVGVASSTGSNLIVPFNVKSTGSDSAPSKYGNHICIWGEYSSGGIFFTGMPYSQLSTMTAYNAPTSIIFPNSSGTVVDGPTLTNVEPNKVYFLRIYHRVSDSAGNITIDCGSQTVKFFLLPSQVPSDKTVQLGLPEFSSGAWYFGFYTSTSAYSEASSDNSAVQTIDLSTVKSESL